MPIYEVEGTDATGVGHQMLVSANSEGEASHKIRQEGIVVTKVRIAPAPNQPHSHSKIYLTSMAIIVGALFCLGVVAGLLLGLIF
jgi:type II secretory pathway component PulF